MKTIRAYGHGFLLRRGLLNIGRNYKTGNWAIELRWSWGYIPAWSLRLYLGQVKPSRERIRFCHVISPVVYGVALACCYSSLSYCLWCSVRRLRDSSGDEQAAFMAGR